MSDRIEPDHLVPTGFFALRTPLLPFANLAGLGAGLAAAAAEPAALAGALAADRALLRARLRDAAARPEVREAIFLASPSFDERLATWLAGPAGAEDAKIERVLYRYLARMCARPTPFGLFAGAGVGTIGEATRLGLRERAAARKHSRLDMDFLFALGEAAARSPALRDALVYRPNLSLYRAPGRVRLAAARLEGRARSYVLVAVEPTAYLDATLARAAGGARLDGLIAALVDGEITRDDAAAYVDELVESQILVPDLAPWVTGPEPSATLAANLARHPEGASLAAILAAADEALAALDAGGLGAPPERYRAVARGLAGLPVAPELPRLFQVNLVKPTAGATLGPAVVREIARAVALLHRLTPADDRLGAFTAAFVARYGDQEVPLLEALDEESGVPFGGAGGAGAFAEPLLEGLAFPSRAAGEVRWGPREDLLLAKIDEARRLRALTVTLADRDLAILAGHPPPEPLPDAMGVLATIASASEEALARGDFAVLVRSASGPSGANLLGRFCHANPELHAWVERHLREEEALAPGVILAEVVHLPEGRLGNVLLRPVLRGHEIAFLGRSGAPEAGQILPSNLVLRVRDGRLTLRSRRLDAEVSPRLTTAHNHWSPRNLGVYRLLCALQHRGRAASLGFDWGPLAGAPFLPRVVRGRQVLARARWTLRRDNLDTLAKARGAARFAAVQALRDGLGLPRWIALEDGDQELPVDLDSVLAVETLAQLVEGRTSARLVELFPGEDALCARGPEGAFTHEIVVPMVRRAPLPAAAARPVSLPPARAHRIFAPGSEWLFVKLYAGAATLDRVLVEVVAPAAGRAVASGAAEGWFFIRYADPGWHLRVRLHGDPARLWGEVFPDLARAAQAFVDEDRIATVVVDTYERENRPLRGRLRDGAGRADVLGRQRGGGGDRRGPRRQGGSGGGALAHRAGGGRQAPGGSGALRRGKARRAGAGAAVRGGHAPRAAARGELPQGAGGAPAAARRGERRGEPAGAGAGAAAPAVRADGACRGGAAGAGARGAPVAIRGGAGGELRAHVREPAVPGRGERAGAGGVQSARAPVRVEAGARALVRGAQGATGGRFRGW